MTHLRLFVVSATVVLCSLIVSPILAEPIADSGEHDIGALLDEAHQLFSFEAEDAVILLQQERRLWTRDGRRIQEIHRIVWIGTSRGIRSYADLRVPWDSAHQTLTVSTLRSWRPSDERWTESGPTAIVETTPYALSHAVDYTNLRETMLLHDGVELPCVLETRYRIEDNEAYAGGMDGVYAMAQRDPTLTSELIIGAPAGTGIMVDSEGVQAREESNVGTHDLKLWTYRSRALEPLPHPVPAATEGAHVAWSTWADQKSLANLLSARVDGAAKLDDASRAAALNAIEDARSPIERAEKLAEWVAESTAIVSYDRKWFPQPRPAHRTWSTAYAHALDRAVLAAAVFRDAGFGADLAYRRPQGVTLPQAVATLSLIEGPLLWVVGDAFEGVYDPADSSLAIGTPALTGDNLWRLGDIPVSEADRITNSAELRLELEWNAEESRWQGTGMLRADGALSPFARMQGLEANRSRKVLETLAGTVFDGAEVGALNFESFAPEAVHAGFTVTVDAGERDSQDRLRLEIGDPTSSLNDPFHSAAPLYQSTRGSAVFLEAPVEVVVEIHLDTGDLTAVAMPGTYEIHNDVGRFKIEVEQTEEGIMLRRSLRVDSAEVDAESWPQLRALLLANSSLKNQAVVLE